MNPILKVRFAQINHIAGSFKKAETEGGKIENIEKAEESEKSGGDHWITVNGRHILIGEGGEVKQGGQGIAGGKDLKKVGSSKSNRKISGDVPEEDGKGKKIKVDVNPDKIGYTIYNVGPGGKETVEKHVEPKKK